MVTRFAWSCWADSNRRPHPYQPKFEIFYNIFRLFLAVSAPFNLISSTFQACRFRIFRAGLWLFVWSKGSPAENTRLQGKPFLVYSLPLSRELNSPFSALPKKRYMGTLVPGYHLGDRFHRETGCFHIGVDNNVYNSKGGTRRILRSYAL